VFRNRPWHLAILAVVATMGIAGFALRGQSSSSDVQAQSASKSPQSRKAGGVTASGVLKPALVVSVSTQLSGTVAAILVDFNDVVQKDQPIARLAADTFEAAVRESRAGLAVATTTAQLRAAAVERTKTKLDAARSELAKADARRLGAHAEFERSERELKRKQQLAKRGNIPARELENAQSAKAVADAALREAEAGRQAGKAAVLTAEAEVKMAEADRNVAQAVVAQREAAADRARIDLAQTIIRAPVDGVILSRSVEVGQTIAANLNAPTLFTVAGNLREMEVHASIDESDIGQISIGQSATFTVDAYPDETFRGVVRQIQKASKTMQNVVTYTIVIATKNKNAKLLPGMTTLVRIKSDKVPLADATSRR
jgi:HlyD family secretion protein